MKKEGQSKMNIRYPIEKRMIRHTVHSLKRTAQRGIRNLWISTVVREGNVIFKQGFRFFYMTKKDLRFLEPVLQDKVKNLVVVMAGNDNIVITCYKNEGAINHIKHKSKRLIKN